MCSELACPRRSFTQLAELREGVPGEVGALCGHPTAEINRMTGARSRTKSKSRILTAIADPSEREPFQLAPPRENFPSR